MKTHKDLEVWNDSIELTNKVYAQTKTFPRHERFGLGSQLERSAVSVASNIAEGAARSSDKEFIKFLNYSIGSSSELETQLIVAKNQNYINDVEELLEAVGIIRQKLCGLVRFLKKRINQ